MHGLFQWGRGGARYVSGFTHFVTNTRTSSLRRPASSPHATPPEDFRLTHVPGSRRGKSRGTRDTDIALSGSAAARAPRQRKSRPEWRQTRNHSTDCSINTPKHSGALQKPNGSQHAASTLLTCGVDTVKRQHPRRLPYAFVWLHELRLHEYRLLAMLPRCSLGAESSTSAYSPRARCPPPPPHRWEPISKIEDPSDELVGSCSHRNIRSIGRQRTNFEAAQSIP